MKRKKKKKEEKKNRNLKRKRSDLADESEGREGQLGGSDGRGDQLIVVLLDLVAGGNQGELESQKNRKLVKKQFT